MLDNSQEVSGHIELKLQEAEGLLQDKNRII